jgi:hypothetical protein
MDGNFVFKSTNRGDAWTAISPELTTDKLGTITTTAESTVDASVLYAGTDDGNVWSASDGKSWKNITAKVPEMPGKRWVNRLVASRYREILPHLGRSGPRGTTVRRGPSGSDRGRPDPGTGGTRCQASR